MSIFAIDKSKYKLACSTDPKKGKLLSEIRKVDLSLKRPRVCKQLINN